MSILSLSSIDTAVINVTMQMYDPDLDKTSYAGTDNENYRDLNTYSYYSVNNILVKSAIDSTIDTQYRVAIEHPKISANNTGYHLPNDDEVVPLPLEKNYITIPLTGTGWSINTEPEPINFDLLPTLVSSEFSDSRTIYTNNAHQDNNLSFLTFDEAKNKAQKPKAYVSEGKSYIYINDPNETTTRKGSFRGFTLGVDSLALQVSGTEIFCSMINKLIVGATEYAVNFVSSGTYTGSSQSADVTANIGKFIVLSTNAVAPAMIYNGTQLVASDFVHLQKDTGVPEVYFCVDQAKNPVTLGTFDRGFFRTDLALTSSGSSIFSSKNKYLAGNTVTYGGSSYKIALNESLPTDGITFNNTTIPDYSFDVVAIRGTNNRRPWIYINSDQNQGIVPLDMAGKYIEIMNTRIPISNPASLTNPVSVPFVSPTVDKTSTVNAPFILVLPDLGNSLDRSVVIGQFARNAFDQQFTYKFYLEHKKPSDTKWTRVIDSNDFTSEVVDIFSDDYAPYKLRIIPIDADYFLKPILISMDYSTRTFTIYNEEFTPIHQDAIPYSDILFFDENYLGPKDLSNALNFNGCNLNLLVPEQKQYEPDSYVISDDFTTTYAVTVKIAPVSDVTVFFVDPNNIPPSNFTYNGKSYSSANVTTSTEQNLPKYVKEIYSTNNGDREGILILTPDYKNPGITYIANTTKITDDLFVHLDGDAGIISSTHYGYIDASLLNSVGENYSFDFFGRRFVQVFIGEHNSNPGYSLRKMIFVDPDKSSGSEYPYALTPYYASSTLTLPHYITSDSKFSTFTSYTLVQKSSTIPIMKVFNVINDNLIQSVFVTSESSLVSSTDDYYFVKYVANEPASGLILQNTGYPYHDGDNLLANSYPNDIHVQAYKARNFHPLPSSGYTYGDFVASPYFTNGEFTDKLHLKIDDGSTGTSTDVTVTDLMQKTGSFPFDNNIDLYFYSNDSEDIQNLISFSYVNDVVTVQSSKLMIDLAGMILDGNNNVNGDKKLSLRVLKGSKVLLKTNIQYENNFGFSNIVIGTDENITGNKLDLEANPLKYNLKKFRIRPSESSSVYNEFELLNVDGKLCVSIYVRTSLKDFSFATLGITRYLTTGAVDIAQEFTKSLAI